jgi:hypothetical protein
VYGDVHDAVLRGLPDAMDALRLLLGVLRAGDALRSLRDQYHD